MKEISILVPSWTLGMCLNLTEEHFAAINLSLAHSNLHISLEKSSVFHLESPSFTTLFIWLSQLTPEAKPNNFNISGLLWGRLRSCLNAQLVVEFEFWFYHILVVLRWSGHLIFLCFSSLIHKIRIITFIRLLWMLTLANI